MVNELRLFRFVDGVNDTPFPNKEANDEQIVITSFAYNAQRMAVTPTITASIDYPRCLDNDWDVNVYAEYKGEKYYIRQIPSSSKGNTSVMYKHDLTLYSERFILENIYFTDIEKKTENGVDVFVKRETTSIIYRFNLIDYVERLNWSLETSELPYRVYIDSSIENSEKAKETKDIALEHAYLSSAIQEIYNQWEIPFYFEGNNIIVKDCSENINDVVLEYGAENSLLSIKKNNANFRKITRISGYGSDKNIPFYYPNWSQKGVIDAMPLSTNSKLTKSMLTISDMKKFDKKMPLNGNVKYFLKSETQPIFSDTTLNKDGLKYENQTNTKHTFTIPFESIRENNSIVEIKFDIDIYELHKMQSMFISPNGNAILIPENAYTFSPSVLSDLLYSPISFNNSYLLTNYLTNNDNNSWGTKRNRIQCTPTTNSYKKTYAWTKKTDENKRDYYALEIKRTINISLVANSIPKGLYDSNIYCEFTTSDSIKKGDIIALYKNKEYPATINMGDYIDIKLYNISIVYPDSDAAKGWYLNETKKINLADIGISVNGTPDDSWNGEGFTQEMVSKIPTAPNLMPSLYRNSIGERKFYNAINYPRPLYLSPVDAESGEYQNDFNVENQNYSDSEGVHYNFETLWTQNNQNEHIQEFSEIYPSITSVTNANNQPIDEILDVWFDENDNNEVDEEGKLIHPYFYVRIPQFSGNNGFGFNLFDHKIVGEEMQVAMTSGDCAACNFKIMVKTQVSEGNETYEDVINPIKTQDVMGKRVPISGNWEEKTSGDFGSEDTTQQDSRNGSIWLVLEKDNQTFNETYPNYAKGVYPKVGDKFVLLNIDMPRSYVLEAEEKLTKEVIKYMSQNNSDKWNFDIDFSRIFLQENQEFYGRLDENCKLYVKYNGLIYNFYVNNYKYEVKSNEALPKITVGLVDTITVNRGVTQNVVDGVMKAIQQTYDVEEGLDYDALYFRKSVPETITQKTTFDNDVDVNGNLNVGEIKLKKLQSPMYGGDEVLGTGFKLEEDENGNSTLTVDNVNVRKKLKATEFVIQQIQFQGGIVIQSAAAMECNRVETLENGNFKCYFDTKEGSVSNQFMLNDLARCQRVGYAPKYYWRKVVEIGSDYIVLSNVNGEYESNSDAPSEGDIIVQMGNTTNTDRQSAIEMNTVGENSPSFIMYSGINTFSLLEKDVTGIVYHQKVVDENGNVIIKAYPELYSYGSMYFGDRKKQNNFIQFAPNADGTFEMLINAKTSFQGGTSDLGTALDDLLNGVQDAQNAIDNLEVGGTNLVQGTANGNGWTGYDTLGNGVFYAKNTLNKTDYSIVSPKNISLEIGTYTLSFEMKANYATKGIQVWLIDSKDWNPATLLATIIDNNGTFDWTKHKVTFTIESNGEECFLRFDNDGNNISKETELWLRRIKLEKGTVATDWSISPDDVTQAIADAEDRTMDALANEVVTINGGIDALQKQVDGEVNSWFMEGEPTLNNAPAKDWTTEELKQRHDGDTYTDISEITLLGSWLWEQGGYVGSTGNAYESLTNIRTKDFIENKGGVLFVPFGYQIGIIYYNSNNGWQKIVWVTKNTQLDTNYPKFKLNFSSSSSNSTTPILPSIADELKFSINPTAGQSWRWCNVDDEYGTGWHWHKIADSDAVKALAEAGKAQATADGKSTTFVVQPSNYSEGDLWILASDTIVNGTAYKAGTILTANEASATYVASHWGEKVKYTDDTAVNNLQIGGVNLLPFYNIKTWSGSDFIKERPKITFSPNANYQGSLQIPASLITIGTEYVLSFKIKKISGSYITIGGHFGTGTSEVWVDGVKFNGTWDGGAPITDNTNEHYVVVKFKQTVSAYDNNVYIQPNRGNYSTTYRTQIYDMQLEIGNKATAWKPNDADIIEARTNILQGGMLTTIKATPSTDNYEYSAFTPTIGLKANTEYVFSVERIIVNSGSPTSITVAIYNSGISTLRKEYTIPINTNKATIYNFTTPSTVTSTDVFLIYAGLKGSTAGNELAFAGLKLAEGNKYTGYEVNPAEKDTIMALQAAMKGSTDIIGGLMLTNMIGMKDSVGVIKSGISGLSENDNLRFWAGSEGWGTEQNAPFRVYDDGRVFGTHFYGFFSAFEVNDSNKNTYITNNKLDFAKTGGSVLLNLSSLNSIISMPDALNYLGSEVEIYNPKRLGLAFCNQMPDYDVCSIDNMFEQFEGALNSSSYYYTDYNWKAVKKTCSQATSSPLYMKFRCVVVPLGSKGFTSTSAVTQCYTVKYNGIFYYVPVWILVEKID